MQASICPTKKWKDIKLYKYIDIIKRLLTFLNIIREASATKNRGPNTNYSNFDNSLQLPLINSINLLEKDLIFLICSILRQSKKVLLVLHH